MAGVFCACHSDDTDAPDAGDGDDSGLVVRWASTPTTWPADLGSGVTIDRARFKIDSLRVVGDAGPGDPRTTATSFEIRWDSETHPSDLVFEQAPPGVYSLVALSIDAHLVDAAFEIRGHVFVENTEWEYRIEDDAPLGFSVGIDARLAPGGRADVRIRIDFAHALDAVDFRNLPTVDGHLELNSYDSQMPTFRRTLIESFQAANADTSPR